VACKANIYIKVYDCNRKRINIMPLEELVAEILASRMPVDFNIEALKAQALLIRTGIVRQLPIYDGKGCQLYHGADLCNSKHCEKWLPREELEILWAESFQNKWDKIIEAVMSTRGEIITVNNKPVQPFYHVCCGGATENSEDVIGNKILYLRKVLCDHCKGSLYWESSRDITMEEMEEKLGVKIKRANPVKASSIEGIIDQIDRDREGRIRSIRIGGRYFGGSDIKDLLGLNSTRFGWDPLIFRFYSGGKGHGLGMCQHGANAMAVKGSSYRKIIHYYFTGVEIVCMKEFEKGKPLKGKVFVLDPGHGGDNSDNIGIRGLREKDVNIDIALKLTGILQEAGAEVYLTRKDDRKVLLSRRAEIANSIRPHFFISIHQNAIENPSVSGTEIYYFRGDKEGEELGRLIMEQLIKEINVTDKGVRTANFYILREIKVSSILLEVSYITNPEEEKNLAIEDFRKYIAIGIFKGIMSYYGQK